MAASQFFCVVWNKFEIRDNKISLNRIRVINSIVNLNKEIVYEVRCHPVGLRWNLGQFKAQKSIAITKDIISVVAPHLSGDNLPKYLLSEALTMKPTTVLKTGKPCMSTTTAYHMTEMPIAGGCGRSIKRKSNASLVV